MPTDPKVSLSVFHRTLSERLKNTLQSIVQISRFEDANLQLFVLETACLTLKNACVYEYGQFLEHAKKFPQKFNEEFISALEFNEMTSILERLIENGIDQVEAILQKTKSTEYLDALKLPINEHINNMHERMSRNTAIKEKIKEKLSLPASQNMHGFMSAPVATAITVSSHDVVLSGDLLMQIKN